MDGMDHDDKPVVPERCPRCGMKIILQSEDKFECPACGTLYYDPWLGIWRIQYREVEED